MKEIVIKELRVAGYLRKSSDSEDKQVQSIATQEREVGLLFERHELKVGKECLYAETKSAFSPGREEFGRMVSDIEFGKINALGAIHASRFARNPVDAGIVINLMDRGKLLAIITPTKIYLNTPTDKMMLAIELIFSKKDSDDKSEWVKTGLTTRAINGLPSGVASIGFLNDMTGDRGNRKWKVDKDRFPLVKLMFERVLEGADSPGHIYRWVTEVLKLTTPKHKRSGGQLITRSRFYEILKDPVFAGFFFREGVKYNLDPSLPRAITEDQHYLILRRLGDNYSPKTKNHLGTYTGFMRGADGGFMGQDPHLQVICDCGKKYSYANKEICPACSASRFNLTKAKYLEYMYYYNVARKKKREGAAHIEEKDITDYLVNYVSSNLTLSSELAEWSKKYLKELQDKDIEDKRVLAERQSRAKEEYESKKRRYRQMLADEYITLAEYKADIARLDRESTSKASDSADRWFEKAEDITDLTVELANILEHGMVRSKRSVLNKLGSNLIWDEKSLSIINTKPIQTLIDGLNEAKRKHSKFEPKNNLADKDKSGVFAAVCPDLLRGQDSNLEPTP